MGAVQNEKDENRKTETEKQKLWNLDINGYSVIGTDD